jgi:hypothetical protein
MNGGGSATTPATKVVSGFTIQQASPRQQNPRLQSPRQQSPRQTTQQSRPQQIVNNSLAQQVVRNKFLTTIERKPDFESSFGDTFSTKSLIGDDEDSLLSDSRDTLANIIEMGLETFEVVNVQPEVESDRPCYICRSTKTKEDLFYCSACCAPFHQRCLGQSAQGNSTCSNCSNSSGKGAGGQGQQLDFEQAMIARAESIHAKCEQIDGAEYQVISFLSSDNTEPLKVNLQVDHSAAPVSLSSLTASQSTVLVDLPQVFLQPGACGGEALQQQTSNLQPLNDLPQTYDMDFDAYLQTISLHE